MPDCDVWHLRIDEIMELYGVSRKLAEFRRGLFA